MTRLRAAIAGAALLAATLLTAHDAQAQRAHCGVRFGDGGRPPACQPAVSSHTLHGPQDWWWGLRPTARRS